MVNQDEDNSDDHDNDDYGYDDYVSIHPHPCEHILISNSLDWRSSLSHKLSRKYPSAFFGARLKFFE